MNIPKVMTDGRISINIADLKCIKVENVKNENVNKSILVFEFKSRFEYIFNPETKKYEKTEFNDKATYDFSEYEMAIAYKNDWGTYWQDYLDENKKK